MNKYITLFKSNFFLYSILCLFCILLACLANNYDYDLFARLLVGEHFFTFGHLAYKDFLSYTPTHNWYDHEYGASLIFYFFYKILGPFGLIISHALTLFGTVYFVRKTQLLQKHAYPTSVFFLVVFLLFLSHLNPNIVRCHMFSFLFYAITLYILEKTRLYNSKLIWLMPAIIIVWNNIHGGVVSGLGIIFIYMIGEILTKNEWKKYLFVLLISTPLLVINPYGLEYLNFLFSANTKNRTYITEWWPAIANRHILYYYQPFCISAITSLIALCDITNKKRFNLTRFLALLTTTYLGFTHVKLLSIAIITVASLYHNEILSFLHKKTIKIANIITTLVISISVLYIPFTHPLTARVDLEKFPAMETEFLKINKISGNILTSFGQGSFVSYKLYPQNLIYMDGRYEEVYYDKEFDNLMHFERGDKTWDTVLKEYPTEILILEKDSHCYNYFKNIPTWTKIYEGHSAAIYIKKNKKRNNYLKPSENIKFYQRTAFDKIGQFSK